MTTLSRTASIAGDIAHVEWLDQHERQDGSPSANAGTGLASLLLRNAWQSGWQALAAGNVDEAVAQFAQAALLAHANGDAMVDAILEAEWLAQRMREMAIQRERYRSAYIDADTAVHETRIRLDQLLDSATGHASGWLGRLLTATGIRVRVSDPVIRLPDTIDTDAEPVSVSTDTCRMGARQIALPLAETAPIDTIAPSKKVRLAPTVGQATEPSVAIYMMGPLRMSFCAASIDRWTSGRARDVMAYLALHRGQTVSRDTLMAALWPDASASSARNSLNVAVHNLRRALKDAQLPELVHYHAGEYFIDFDTPVWVDADVLTQHVELGRQLEANHAFDEAIAQYEAAAVLYQGDLLNDNLYADWAVMPREMVRSAYMDALSRLSHIHFGRGQYAMCIAQCQRILALDRCREDMHCMIMRCQARQNQPHLAMLQFRACVDALKRELDVEPSLTTVQLFDRIHNRVAV